MAKETVQSEMTGKVWKLNVEVGASVAEDEEIIILESMKMEIPVTAPVAGKLGKFLVGEGDEVAEGQDVAVIEI
ncbi:MAG TPA: acetyl-CoA carboxylase biotin carboxyl carrier protein subunit [Alphaproteobacteria bacterium]|nr:acetyl-CoA carboxylase biotin carboxyl carrier protein subunit [Alphaproteobacteria bacterium]MDP7427465.1 acetyl-CoA carboxylase biotin carboxyl carrier protein subunit [Alphaproteobacteria bacterium]HJM49873.1 acetyl-CoA carboxylase biotin carboxyl carrier protein subunit [Alphaproteobacteria bacterium]